MTPWTFCHRRSSRRRRTHLRRHLSSEPPGRGTKQASSILPPEKWHTRHSEISRQRSCPCRENLESFLARHSRRPRFRRATFPPVQASARPHCSRASPRARSFSPTGKHGIPITTTPPLLVTKDASSPASKRFPSKGNPIALQKFFTALLLKACRPVLSWDITKQYETRRRAILAYRSQFPAGEK